MVKLSFIDEEEVEEHSEPEFHRETNKERKKNWVIYFAWTFCILVILSCSIIIIFYGMQFGNVKSLQWLSTITFSLAHDFLLVQPARVMLVALFMALVVKTCRGGETKEERERKQQVKKLSENKLWLSKDNQEDDSDREKNDIVDESIFNRIDTHLVNLPDLSTLEEARLKLVKEKAMNRLTKEIGSYMIFTMVLIVMAFMARNQWAFHQNRDVEELLRLHLRNDLKKYKNKPTNKDTIFTQVNHNRS